MRFKAQRPVRHELARFLPPPLFSACPATSPSPFLHRPHRSANFAGQDSPASSQMPTKYSIALEGLDPDRAQVQPPASVDFPSMTPKTLARAM